MNCEVEKEIPNSIYYREVIKWIKTKKEFIRFPSKQQMLVKIGVEPVKVTYLYLCTNK